MQVVLLVHVSAKQFSKVGVPISSRMNGPHRSPPARAGWPTSLPTREPVGPFPPRPAGGQLSGAWLRGHCLLCGACSEHEPVFLLRRLPPPHTFAGILNRSSELQFMNAWVADGPSHSEVRPLPLAFLSINQFSLCPPRCPVFCLPLGKPLLTSGSRRRLPRLLEASWFPPRHLDFPSTWNSLFPLV